MNLQEDGFKKTKDDRPNFNAITEKEEKHQIEEVGKKLREMMPFVNEAEKAKEVVASAKN